MQAKSRPAVHPVTDASTVLASGMSIGVAIAFVARALGIEMSAEEGTALGAVVSAVAAGIANVWRTSRAR